MLILKVPRNYHITLEKKKKPKHLGGGRDVWHTWAAAARQFLHVGEGEREMGWAERPTAAWRTVGGGAARAEVEVWAPRRGCGAHRIERGGGRRAAAAAHSHRKGEEDGEGG